MQLWERWRLAFDDRMPIYRQISLQLSQAFVRGDVCPGERIPSIREMSAILKVNTNTVQRSYQEMEREGLICSKRGTGYFLTEDINMKEKTRLNLAQDSMSRFTDEMCALGRKDKEIIDELILFMKGGKKRETSS
jgi:DNA-binding transcriptional regulator YhcF (GntR family)